MGCDVCSSASLSQQTHNTHKHTRAEQEYCVFYHAYNSACLIYEVQAEVG